MADRLGNWAVHGGRLLPWRQSPGPYATLAAEILLQKTKARAVVPVWEQLLETYPEPQALLAASETELGGIIGGLGLREQRVARLRAAVRAMLDGRRPCPGLGSYGRAVQELSQEQPRTTIPVDGNIARVVTRAWGFHWERGEPRRKPETRRIVDALLGNRPPVEQLGTLYALVDLGAMICAPRRPSCASCPLLPDCVYASSSGGSSSEAATAEPIAAASGGGTESETRRI